MERAGVSNEEKSWQLACAVAFVASAAGVVIAVMLAQFADVPRLILVLGAAAVGLAIGAQLPPFSPARSGDDHERPMDLAA